jgi:hypothetical protein
MMSSVFAISPRRRRVKAAKWTALTAALLGLPLVGIVLAGRPLDPYMEFPPRALGEAPTHFTMSWSAFIAYAAFVAAVSLPLLARLVRTPGDAEGDPAPRAFPWWGWTGLAFGGLAWVLAWTRFEWFAPLQGQTFVPLWAAYLVVANALALRRAGRAPAIAWPVRYAALFAASALFWWSFEYLNRFPKNWRYVGIDRFGPVEYGTLATLAFATVLPAYVATQVGIAAWPRFDRAFRDWIPVRLTYPRASAAGALVASAAGLAFLGLHPDVLFPLVWVAPVLVVVGVQTLRGRPHVLSGIAHGDWRRPVAAAAAALVCGLFWETWNWGSLAKWQYDIPYVGRFHVFEMPLLGYAGYLPFGLMCATVADAILDASPTDARDSAAVRPSAT